MRLVGFFICLGSVPLPRLIYFLETVANRKPNKPEPPAPSPVVDLNLKNQHALEFLSPLLPTLNVVLIAYHGGRCDATGATLPEGSRPARPARGRERRASSGSAVGRDPGDIKARMKKGSCPPTVSFLLTAWIVT